MNFVAHIAVGARARGATHDDLFLAGTALPDFASMARIRLNPTGGPLGRGIAFHHATDHVFHSDHRFLDFEHELRSALARVRLPDGGARLCAHVGPELLLDGALLRDAELAAAVEGVYQQIAPAEGPILDAAGEHERSDWADHLARITTTLDPHLYADPEAVARLLCRIAARRPRLAFDGRHIPVVADQLAHMQPAVATVAHELVEDIAAGARRASSL